MPGAFALRVDVGASQGHSNAGLYWKADRDYSAASYGRLDKGPSYSSGSAVEQSSDPGLFQSFRQGQAIEYQADVPDGVYAVVLHFAEFVVKAAGQRQMQLSLQGVTQTGSIDVYDQVQAGRALRLRYEAVTVSAGTLNFKLQAVSGKAELAAFEVRGLYTPGPTPTKTPQGAPLSLELLEPAGAVLQPQP